MQHASLHTMTACNRVRAHVRQVGEGQSTSLARSWSESAATPPASPGSPVASVIKQLSHRALISNAATLVKHLSSRSNSATSADSPKVAKAVAAVEPAPLPRKDMTLIEPAKPKPDMCPMVVAFILGSGLVLGWVPLLVTGVVYYTHPISGDHPHTAPSQRIQWGKTDFTMLARTLAGNSTAAADNGGRGDVNPVAMIVCGTIWGFILCCNIVKRCLCARAGACLRGHKYVEGRNLKK